jgi:DegV family protein with EDD domain
LVAVVVDSAANIPADLVDSLGIEVVPLHLRFGEQSLRDGVDIALEDFYRRLLRDREVAVTSAPSPGDYLQAFERTGQKEIVSVSVAGNLSSSLQQAALAAQRFPGRVELVDSSSASMGEGFPAVEAARVAAEGGTLDQAAERAREVCRRTWLFATVGTFEFLRRSGRVTALQAYAATMLDIKPVFSLHRGEIASVARARTRRRALRRIGDESLQRIGARPCHLAVLHAAAEDEANEMTELIREGADVVESFVVPITPVMGAHTGPGLVGTAFYCD